MRKKFLPFVNHAAIIFGALLVFGGSPALACSCMSKGQFLEYAEQGAGVIHARVVRYGDKLSHGETLYDRMVVEVVAVITGGFELDSLILMGDPGHLCREYVDSRNFVIGNEYLIALHGNEPVQPFGGCGEAWLAVKDESVEGYAFVEGGYRKYSRPLAEVLEALNGK